MQKMTSTFVTVLVTLVYLVPVSRSEGVTSTNDVLAHFTNQSDRRVRPLDGTGVPVNVNISMYVGNMRSVREDTMGMSVDMYFRQLWTDPRLAWGDGGPDQVTLGADDAARIVWMPDLFFVNTHEATMHNLVKDSSGLRIKRNGSILHSTKFNVVFDCDMDLRRFPFDTQRCKLSLESYMYSNSDIDLRWNSISFDQSSQPPAFSLLDVTNSTRRFMLSSGQFTRLDAIFALQRISRHWAALVYAPSLLLVVMSCLLFWMPFRALLDRTFLASFLLVAMMPILTGSQYGAPQVGYLKAIDVWVLVCFLFLFVAVMELLVLHALSASFGLARSDNFEMMEEPGVEGSDKAVLFGRITPAFLPRLDWIMRISYPAVFVVFNAIYWGVESS